MDEPIFRAYIPYATPVGRISEGRAGAALGRLGIVRDVSAWERYRFDDENPYKNKKCTANSLALRWRHMDETGQTGIRE
jgi:hypothetical protein